jgi:hypothetical protein
LCDVTGIQSTELYFLNAFGHTAVAEGVMNVIVRHLA